MGDEANHAAAAAMETAAVMVSTGAGLAVGGPAGAAVGAAAAPVMTAGLQSLVEHVSRWRMRRAGQAFSLAARLCGMPEDDFARHVGSSERLSELAGRVLLTVQDTALPSKRDALSRVLAQAGQARDNPEAACERGLILARAIAALDGPHIRAMVNLADRPGLPDPVPSSDPDGAKWGYRSDELAEADPSLSGIAEAVIRELLSVGLVEDATNGMTFLQRARAYALSPLGRDVLAILRDSSSG